MYQTIVMMHILLENGVDMFACDADGKTVFMHAVCDDKRRWAGEYDHVSVVLIRDLVGHLLRRQ
jgi:hypothetical protein